jgi:glycosyltransferase involved in cell wall biosynthesis
MLSLFYEEPDEDRWVPLDRHPRRIIRRLVRGPLRVGGQRRVFLNLCAGLDPIGAPYRTNDYAFARSNPADLVCIVGKPFLLDKVAWKNPILFGSGVPSHPVDDPRLLDRLPIRKVLVPGPWMKAMCEPYWPGVEHWPVGIDTERWHPSAESHKECDVLLYDKVLWNREQLSVSLIEPIRAMLRDRRRSDVEVRYRSYEEKDFRAALSRSRAMIFLCEHETQGIAYQQALACGVPILAWDKGGPWQDPADYPHKVLFEPVTSVPYWDERCGRRFSGPGDVAEAWDRFWEEVAASRFEPRSYVLEAHTATLERECMRELARYGYRVRRLEADPGGEEITRHLVATPE